MKEFILAYSNFNKMFKLYMNALDIELEAILMQKDNQKRNQVVCYKAKILLLAKKNYPTTEKEYLIII